MNALAKLLIPASQYNDQYWDDYAFMTLREINDRKRDQMLSAALKNAKRVPKAAPVDDPFDSPFFREEKAKSDRLALEKSYWDNPDRLNTDAGSGWGGR